MNGVNAILPVTLLHPVAKTIAVNNVSLVAGELPVYGSLLTLDQPL